MANIVLASGVFGVFHYGHLLHLEEARKMGDILVVAVIDDAHVDRWKGRAFYPQDHRVEILRSLKCVDSVILVALMIEALEWVRPKILVKGSDYLQGLDPVHTGYCKRHDIEIRFTKSPKYSAMKMISEHLHL